MIFIRYIVIKKNSHFIIIVFAIIAVCFIGIEFNTLQPVSESIRKLPIYAVETDKMQIALTFDCAWENSDTNQLIDIMEREAIKATFFATGDFCERNPDDIKLLASKGHSIQNHSNKHPHVENIDPQKLIDDTTKCDEIITALTGKKPTLYRAPYGEYSNSMLTVFEEALGHKVIQWDCDSIDWKGRTVEQMVTTVLKKTKKGSIILFHNDTKNTPEALQIIIPKLKAKGYEFVLVEDLIYKDGYTLNHEGRQVLS